MVSVAAGETRAIPSCNGCMRSSCASLDGRGRGETHVSDGRPMILPSGMKAPTGGRALDGRTVVVIGGTTGIGLATARLAREQGADVLITARGQGRLRRIGVELGVRTAAFDATDFERLGQFFAD